MPNTGTLRLVLLTVDGQPAVDPDTLIRFHRASDGTTLGQDTAAFPNSQRYVLPAFPREHALTVYIAPSRYRARMFGPFTLTSGDLSQAPGPGRFAVSLTGAAVEMFARAAAFDLDGRYRLNVVSPGWVAESRVKAGHDAMPGIWARDLAEYYADLVDGDQTGQVVNASTAKA